MIIVSGPSGSGKSTVVEKLAETYPYQYEVVRSVTTREPRNSDDLYTFVTKEKFLEMQKQDLFLETNVYTGNQNYYGTPLEDVNRIITSGKTPILEIDINGKEQVMKKADSLNQEIKTIFLVAEAEELYERLLHRGDTTESILSRFKASLPELTAAPSYDAFVINEDLSETVKQIQHIITNNLKTDQLAADQYITSFKHLIDKIEHTVHSQK